MNRADKLRMEVIHAMPCIACVIARNTMHCGLVEAHHIVDGGYRKHSGGHSASLPLGRWHHRAQPLTLEWTVKQMEATFGPSLANNKRLFVATYGSERDLLARVDAAIGTPEVA